MSRKQDKDVKTYRVEMMEMEMGLERDGTWAHSLCPTSQQHTQASQSAYYTLRPPTTTLTCGRM